MQENQPVTPSTPGDQKNLAIASLVVGVINLCAWLLPICGGPLAIAGLVLGYLGLKSSQRNLAIAGMVLSGITLCLAIVNAIAGVVLAPELQNIFDTINQSLGY
jgi:hypothetical protein